MTKIIEIPFYAQACLGFILGALLGASVYYAHLPQMTAQDNFEGPILTKETAISSANEFLQKDGIGSIMSRKFHLRYKEARWMTNHLTLLVTANKSPEEKEQFLVWGSRLDGKLLAIFPVGEVTSIGASERPNDINLFGILR